MSDLLNLGTSALLSMQQAINTTGHNISNVNTEGFSRQRVNLETLPPGLDGGHYMGNGVGVESVERYYDQFLSAEVRTRTSAQSESQTFYDLSSRMDSLLADPAVGLTPVMDSFFAAVQDVANNPGSMPERNVLLGEAQVLAERFQYLYDSFSSLGAEVNGQIEAVTGEINALSQGIADLNQQIVQATAAAAGQPPNDLLDARDQLITELSEKIDVTTYAQGDGSINVSIGNGQSLVVGFTAEQLQVTTDPYDPSRVMVGVDSPTGVATDISRFLSGGELGALLDFREEQLDPAMNQLGLVAIGLSATFNEQHQQGLDINGQPGEAFFLPPEASFSAHKDNAGAATLDVAISDAGALTADDYKLLYEAGQWTLTNLGTGASQTGAGPFVVDGLTIDVTGAPADGDSFLIQPTRQGAALIEVAVDRPEEVAAASALRSQEALGNFGSAVVDEVAVTDMSALPLPGAVTLTFNPDALGAGVPGFDVAGIAGGPLAYDPAVDGDGKTFSLAGFDLTVSGDPEAGDILTVENNTDGTGDNRNALALGELQTSSQLLGGTASYQDAYGSLVADVAVRTSQAQSSSATESILLQQAISSRDSVSGVNLDEEAANLIHFQQAYQAAAQLISVADQLFQTLLNATRR